MDEGMLAETVTFVGHAGDEIPAYLARPLGSGPCPGVVVVHHMPGWDDATKEITRRFATHGNVGMCPNLHHRDAPGADPDDAAAAARAAGGVPDERFLGDAAGAMAHLRSLPYSSGKVGIIGFCSGGRQSFLAACTLDLDAAVDCYGAFVADAPPPEVSMAVQPVLDRAAGLSGPLLGLFGADDVRPSPQETARIDEELTRLGKVHEFHTFEGAGHGFFAVDRPSYRPEAAVEGWRLIVGWFGRYLAS